MKNLYYLILCLLFVNLTIAQADETTKNTEYKKTNIYPIHEIKANVVLIFLGNANFSYENLLNEESSIGGSMSVPYDDYLINWDLNFSATGFYRFYFGDGYADGIFAEVFAMYNNFEENLKKEQNGVTFREKENVNDFALGFGGGYKLVSKSGRVTADLNLGLGRNLLNSGLEGRDNGFVIRVGVNAGFRF